MRGIMPQTRLWWGKMSTGVVRRVAISSPPPARLIREFLQPREREVGPRDPPSHAWERAGYPTLRRFAGGEASDPDPRQAATVKAARAWEWEALSGPPCSFQRRLLPPSAQTKTPADGGGCQGRRSRRAKRGEPLQTACRSAVGWVATGGGGGRRERRRGRRVVVEVVGHGRERRHQGRKLAAVVSGHDGVDVDVPGQVDLAGDERRG